MTTWLNVKRLGRRLKKKSGTKVKKRNRGAQVTNQNRA